MPSNLFCAENMDQRRVKHRINFCAFLYTVHSIFSTTRQNWEVGFSKRSFLECSDVGFGVCWGGTDGCLLAGALQSVALALKGVILSSHRCDNNLALAGS